jgi:hypothetical protein
MKAIKTLEEIGFYKDQFESVYVHRRHAKSKPFGMPSGLRISNEPVPKIFFQDPFSVLPSEISLEIASYLDIPSLPAASRVCTNIFQL